MKQSTIRILIFLIIISVKGQEKLPFPQELWQQYDGFKELKLTQRRFKHKDIQPLIQALAADKKYHIKTVGHSIEGRPIKMISLGRGEVSILLWSQMHGDEPTATQAIFDIFNWFNTDGFEAEKKNILSKVSLHFIPMLNPDGAERFQRRNALGIDINRDALRLQSPEGKLLKRMRDSLQADIAFNLHDQSRYYNAERTPKTATISYLATAFNYEKDINDKRKRAMQLILVMNEVVQKYAPGRVGRYSDDFEPRAFGDNIAKWGSSLILIESGGYPDDVEKQFIRKLNVVSIMAALNSIANESYQHIDYGLYEKIPKNDTKMVDLKLEHLTYNLEGKPYQIDLAINRNEIDLNDHTSYYYHSKIADIGDLSTSYGYQTFDATGYTLVPPKNYIPKEGEQSTLNSLKLLKGGFGYVLKNGLAMKKDDLRFLNQQPSVKQIPKFDLQPGLNATFFLKKEGVITHAVINGFLLDLGKPLENQGFVNAL